MTARVRARGIARGKAPSDRELDDLARRTLRMIMIHGENRDRVNAARATQSVIDPERRFLERLGTEDEAIAWIDRIRPVLAERVAARGKMLKP